MSQSQFTILIVALLSCSIFTSAFYTEETPVKLLEVESFATRYPATESEYRISLINGFVIF